MNSLCFATILFCFFAFSVKAVPTSIRQSFDFRNGSVGNTGNTLVEGYADCGSLGRLVSFNLGECEKTPCTLKAGHTYKAELVSIIAGKYAEFALAVDVKRDDEIENVNYFNFPFPLYPGLAGIYFPTDIQARHKGFNELQIRIIAAGVNEACLLADVNID